MTLRRGVAGAVALLLVLGAITAAGALTGGDGDDGATPSTSTTTSTSSSTPSPEGTVGKTAAGDPVVLRRFGDCRSVVDEARKQALGQVTAYGIAYPGNQQYKNFAQGDA